MTTTMNMLPNDHHPGPRCSCAECQRRYPEVSAPAQPTSKDMVIAAVIAENPYTRYSYPAQNDAVERGRAGRYAIMIAKEALRRTAPEPTNWQQIARERTADLAKANEKIERLRRELYYVEDAYPDVVGEAKRRKAKADAQIERLQRQLNAKQAKIDALMLEFCPGEMSAEQRANWANSQQRAAPEPGDDLAKVAKLVPDQWPGGDVWRIGGRLFVFFEDALAAIRRTAQPPCANDARDAARYRFLRQPGNAIVYAKDRNAWGAAASGHVRYDTSEQLDTAVDAAIAASGPTKCQDCDGTKQTLADRGNFEPTLGPCPTCTAAGERDEQR